MARITFCRGALRESGSAPAHPGCRRVALITDSTGEPHRVVHRSSGVVAASGVDAALYTEVRIEPTNPSNTRRKFFPRGPVWVIQSAAAR